MLLVLKKIAALIYRGIVTFRSWLYNSGILSSYRSRLPVISVGNITAGGNGKTPLCLAIAAELKGRGYNPAILSRGYGGALRRAHRVSISDSFRDVGDEPLLMAQAGFPVFVARRRVAGVKLIEADPKIDVVILDDGFQHRALSRTLDIVAIFIGSERALSAFSRGKLLPEGLFREPRDNALKRADIVVLTHRALLSSSDKQIPVPQQIASLIPRSAGVFSSFLVADTFSSLSDPAVICDTIPGPVCAIAAIANPEGFFKSLEDLGLNVVQRFSFPDHHVFNENKLREITDSYPECSFIATDKDAVKLRALPQAIAKRFYVFKVTARILPHEPFFAAIERAIGKKVVRKEV
jgi:tetraacyldisaccharide 4'-kinase